jgi:uncharacterized protein YndB with AHSA1/START domain
MPDVTVTQIVKATPEQVWAAWDDYGNIVNFNPNLSGSHLLGPQETGKGALRQCDFADGKNHIKERIIEYVPNTRMVLDIYDGTVPLKRATVNISMAAHGADQTRVTLVMSFSPKFGLFGVLLVPIIKGQFRKALQALLKGNADYVEAQAA